LCVPVLGSNSFFFNTVFPETNIHAKFWKYVIWKVRDILNLCSYFYNPLHLASYWISKFYYLQLFVKITKSIVFLRVIIVVETNWYLSFPDFIWLTYFILKS
jgi:hypothetical protein